MSTERESNAALEPREKSQLLRWSRSEGKMDAEVLSSQKKGSGACGAGDRAGTLRGRKRIGKPLVEVDKVSSQTTVTGRPIRTTDIIHRPSASSTSPEASGQNRKLTKGPVENKTKKQPQKKEKYLPNTDTAQASGE